ncbi:UNVERIFIED_CONTAM: Retrovirus-related Pol polyprotein from transposon TNT 1-94 [Sesamum radiatum]|uniref:Retrovirus-related Pol polyprotein from transposon TNT 1-94 n=1 Tax=Sesamum radiatum TaxID=300843 RepID=A0AAW2QJ52_SESRA
MVEDRFVAEQTHEIVNLEHALSDAEMKLPDKFLVGNWAKLCPNKKAKTGQAAVNMVVGGASTSGATEGPSLERTVSMGNSSTAEVHGIGSVDLKFPSRRVLSLKRVHHVPTVRRNIISGSVIVREGYELAFKFNKVVIQQFGIFIDKETPSYSPSSNGVAERKNRTFKDMINSLLLTSGLPKYLWGEALNTACHILNRVPLKHSTSTPFELWKDVFPMKIRIPSSVSLDDSLASTSIPEHVEKMTNVGVNPRSTSLTHEESDEPRWSKRARVVKNFGSDFVTYNIEDDPITFKDAMVSSEAKQWKEAVKSEMDSIVSNGTWKLVDLPLGCTSIGCKWIFKKKLKRDGSVDKFKARLVAKGFKQKEGIDYFDTYSPVARLTTIRVLIALASVYSLPIHQMDVKTALLYGELEEEIYMDHLEGFVAHGNERKVCKLVKSLYGSTQTVA